MPPHFGQSQYHSPRPRSLAGRPRKCKHTNCKNVIIGCSLVTRNKRALGALRGFCSSSHASNKSRNVVTRQHASQLVISISQKSLIGFKKECYLYWCPSHGRSGVTMLRVALDACIQVFFFRNTLLGPFVTMLRVDVLRQDRFRIVASPRIPRRCLCFAFRGHFKQVSID